MQRRGDRNAVHDLGRLLERTGDLDGAAAQYLLLAERDDVDSTIHLANVLLEQHGCSGLVRTRAVRAGAVDKT